ncbi:7901_t:CDS:2 [Ambispora leptoticha]|uniref:7901_t:CDS:1 n=1 Tax=Ambispora leptoticha TaxID=144679 RepID=A0A9N9FDG3_9GLOM|nr:7901_t:CDS:2 [Ambispora leptoticha]
MELEASSSTSTLERSAATSAKTPIVHDPNKLNTLISDYTVALSFIQRGFSFAADAAIDIEEVEEEVEPFDEAMKQLLDYEYELQNQKRIMENMRTRLFKREQIACLIIPNLLEHYESEVNKKMREYEDTPDETKYHQNPNYLEFRQKIWEVKHPDAPMPPIGREEENGDDDVIISTERQSLICPLTTKIFEEPMTSTKCRHSFSKNAILAYIRANSQAKCPTPGCDKILTENDIKLDKSLARRYTNVE